MLVFDRIEINQSKRKVTPEGYLSVPANLARTGIYDYSAEEIEADIKLGVPSHQRMKVYRPSDEVFANDAMTSFSLKPVTEGHPPELVDVNNIKKYQKGFASSEIGRNGEFVTADLLITDADMIKKINDGKCEVSNGYTADFEFVRGCTEHGEMYDAIQRNIRGNHIAIVDKARGGRGCRLSDEETKEKHMTKIMLDGIEFEVTEKTAQAIGKLEAKVTDAEDATKAAKDAAVQDAATKDAEIATLKKAVKDAEAKILDAAAIDALVTERATLVNDAKRLAPDFVCDGKSNEEIVEGVVCKINDGINLEGKDETYKVPYCRALFDAALIAKDAESDGSEKVKPDEKAIDEDMDAEKKRDEFKKETEDMYKSKGGK